VRGNMCVRALRAPLLPIPAPLALLASVWPLCPLLCSTWGRSKVGRLAAERGLPRSCSCSRALGKEVGGCSLSRPRSQLD
jgi:hypothetical protein